MLELRTLGTLDLRWPDGSPVPAVLAQPKRMALLVFLAVARPRGYHRRDTLLAHFWPERDEATARHSLSQALHKLRESLAAETISTRGPDEVGLAEHALRSDVERFEAAVAEGRLNDALALYNGDFLAGLHVDGADGFQRWLDAERDRLRQTAARAAWAHAEELLATGALNDAERTASQACSLAPTDERAARMFIQGLTAAGGRESALGFYDKLRKALNALDLEPSAETQHLLAAVREGDVGGVQDTNGSGQTAHLTRTPRVSSSEQDPVTKVRRGAPPRSEGPAGGDAAVRVAIVDIPHARWSRAKRAAVLTVCALATVSAAWWASRSLGIGPAATLSSRGLFSDSDRVLIADFDSPPNDSALGLVVSDLLRFEIGRSPSLRIVDSYDRGGALLGMALSTNTRVTPSIASEVARRTNAELYLSGTIAAVGTGYVLRATLTETALERQLAEFRRDAPSADGVIEAIDRLGRDIRRELGTSLRHVRGGEPLAWAVTPSLAALRLYTESELFGLQGRNLEALGVLERAVRVDSEFAMAYRRMASWYQNEGDPDRASWASERAFRYRSKLPPVTQRLVEGTYYNQPASYDLDSILAAYHGVLAIRPQLGIALNNLANNYMGLRKPEIALDLWLRNLQTDTTSNFAPHGILGAYWATGRKNEARQFLRDRVSRWQPGAMEVVISESKLAAADFYLDSAAALLEKELARRAAASGTQNHRLWLQLSYIYHTQGRYADSEAALSQFRPAASDTTAGISELVLRRTDALVQSDRLSAATRLLDSATSARPPGDASALGYRWLDVAALYARAGAPERARVFLGSFEQRATPPILRAFREQLEITRGWLALSEGRPQIAIRAFRNADEVGYYVRALAPLGHAYDAAGKPDSAIIAFERYLSTNFLERTRRADWELLAGTYRRLGELYEARGVNHKARHYSARFVDLWQNADPVVQPRVREARRRFARLPSSR